ncbi:hypothetical protein [Phycicoccus avicenniae]|uniref:hypothetical protein n=1 Tax=Phycicoccus avicenniae TaxID=2828860 RepID=UPI003D2E21BD
MTTARSDGFDDFVAARWEQLESVALVATLDPARARGITTDALVAVGGRWGDLVEDGRPGEAARRDLLERLVGGRARGHDGTPGTTVSPAVLEAAAGDPVHEALVEALVEALADLDEPVRALLAAEAVWGVDAGALLRQATGLRPTERTRIATSTAAAREHLRETHRAALVREGHRPDTRELEPELRALAENLCAATGPAPHPDVLVASSTARVRRRVLVGGGGGALAVAALAWWGVSADPTTGPPSTPRATPTPAGPSAAAWASTRTWDARGRLARDVGVQALVARAGRPGGRLLFADDVEGLRLVVATWAQPGDAQGTSLQVWSAPAGTAAQGLAELELAFGGVYEVDDVVAVGVPRPDGALLFFASRPTVALAQYSAYARPTRGGLVSRVWRDVPMTDGVGWAVVDHPGGPALRGRCRAYDGPVPGPMEWSPGSRGFAPDEVRASVSAATGFPLSRLAVRVDRGVVPPDVRVLPSGAAELELRLITVTTPDGGVVRTPVFGEQGDDSQVVTAQETVIVPADRARTPVLVRVDDRSSSRARFMVLAPDGGGSVRLTAPTGAGLSPRVPLQERTAVVTVAEDALLGGFDVVVEDAAGRSVSRTPVLSGRSLYDLSPSNESGTPV